MLAIAQWESTSFSQKESVKEKVKGFPVQRFHIPKVSTFLSFSKALQKFPLAESSLVCYASSRLVWRS